jgi:hypothetical protein
LHLRQLLLDHREIGSALVADPSLDRPIQARGQNRAVELPALLQVALLNGLKLMALTRCSV